MTLQELVEASRGRLHGTPPSGWRYGALTTDSRAVAVGDVFVALVGERFDANDYIDEAVARGAAVVVCSEGRAAQVDRAGHGGHAAVIETADTLQALGDIAAAYRGRFEIAVIAITGSNGKTTTKELLRSILAQAYGADRVLANKGNLNNLIGLPLTVMKLTAHHRAAVLEMGMNAVGEIARLTAIARPTHGMVTCVGAAHLEGLGSIDGVARAKGELFAGMGEDTTAIVNADDARVVDIAAAFRGATMLRYGSAGDVRAEDVRADSLERVCFTLVHDGLRFAVQLPMGGRHNVSNALAAAACALALGVDGKLVADGLGAATPPPMRVAVESLENRVRIVNDAYNANPDSVRAAFSAIADASAAGAGRTIVALGTMLELGARAAELHNLAGRDAAALEPVLLCVMGEHADEVVAGATRAGLGDDRALAVASHAEAARAIAAVWQPGDTVLVKGSRGSQMEAVVEELRKLARS